MRAILGISAFYHDSAAAILVDGQIIAAAQEERFSRVKHDARFPTQAIEYVLREVGISLAQVEHVAFFEKPFLKFERILESYIATVPFGLKSFSLAMPVWLREKLFQKKQIIKKLSEIEPTFDGKKLLFSEHHYSHAASAFFPSPFEEAVVLTLDGVGEWATTTIAIGRGNKLEIEREIHFPHSLGLLYSAFTYYTGFKVNSGEYKLMGLAPYGEPKYKDLILKELIDIKDDGSYWINQHYFNYIGGLTMTNKRFVDLFGHPVRRAETEALTQFHMDIAASVQAVTEEVVLKITRHLAKTTGISNLCLAGGVALNCVANGKILEDQSFDQVWIQPAAGDAGGALGAALAAWYIELSEPRSPRPRDSMRGAYLGPAYTDKQVEQELIQCGAVFDYLPQASMIERTVNALVDGNAVGWFQGRMEFGPRALGARSILGDPRNPNMQRTLNLKVKFRESFRPFAPSILREDLHEYFEINCDSPYMLFVAYIKGARRVAMPEEHKKLFGIEKLKLVRSDIPAVTHVDYSARIQTVHEDTNPHYHALLKRFKSVTGCPVLVNTSFNVRGEPIVNTPGDAFRCFMGTGIEMLVINNFVLDKDKQNRGLLADYRGKYELD